MSICLTVYFLIPTGSEFYQQMQKVKLSDVILTKNRGKINLFLKEMVDAILSL